jgi:glycosyl transferase/beta-hydroxylase protein BlmF
MTINKNTISVICPSRGRQEQLLKMINSARLSADLPESIQFCIYIDDDDDGYNYSAEILKSLNIKFLQGPRFWLSGMFNSLLTIASGDFIFWCGDDVEFKTKGWDTKMKNEILKFQDNICVVYVNDLANYPQKYATIGMVHRKWVSLFGHVFTPHMRDNGIDFWISDISRAIGRLIYLPDVHVEHMQFRQGKGELDGTYLDRINSHKMYSPASLYKSLKDERRRDKLVLSYATGVNLNKEPFRYLLSNIYKKISTPNLDVNRSIYIRSISNYKIIANFLSKYKILYRNKNWS